MRRSILLSFLFLVFTSFNDERHQTSRIRIQLGYSVDTPWGTRMVYGLPRIPGGECFKKVVTDKYGAIVRGDTLSKKIALVFTGDEFADGGYDIIKALKSEKITSSFFLTGRFYSTLEFKPLIRQLRAEEHYLGAHSDQHLLYCDWIKRDSLLVTHQQFSEDLRRNYSQMQKYGVQKADAPYFLPPYEWYNSTIANWTAKEGLQLVNFSPGTRSTADYTWPEMGKSYRPSDEIYQSIIDREENDPNGLNGFILLMHIGTDPRRRDKFHLRLPELIKELKNRGYSFERIDRMLN